METFCLKTKVISGPGSIAELGRLGCRRVLLVADPYFQKTDVPDRLMAACGADFAFFYEVQPDPTVALAAKGTALVQAFQPDTVVA